MKLGKASTGSGDDYTTGCLLDYVYFKDNYRLIAVDLSKQKALDADPRAIQQILFQENVKGDDNTKTTIHYTLFLNNRKNNARVFQRNSKVL